jgi:hypothetical protein
LQRKSEAIKGYTMSGIATWLQANALAVLFPLSLLFLAVTAHREKFESLRPFFTGSTKSLHLACILRLYWMFGLVVATQLVGRFFDNPLAHVGVEPFFTLGTLLLVLAVGWNLFLILSNYLGPFYPLMRAYQDADDAAFKHDVRTSGS